MGRILQIRVMAYTYDEKDMEHEWPELTSLGFPPSSSPSVISPRKGVLELVDSLADQIRFGMLETSIETVLAKGINEATSVKKDLEQALADWNPQKANTLSDNLEEILEELEKSASSL
ncbi:formin-like protein 18 [Desulfoplanes sp.]